jgi:glycosyltransferase involved in cell wall biosynthesis
MLKVAFITAEPFWPRKTGYFGLTARLVEMLGSMAQCSVIILNGGGGDGYCPSGVSPVYLKPGRQPTKRLRQACSVFSSRSAYECEIGYQGISTRLQACLNDLGADVAILNHLRSAFVVRNSRLRNVRTVYWSHNCESAAAASIAKYPLGPLMKWYYQREARKLLALERGVLQNIDTCVALSDRDQDRFRRLAPQQRIVVVPPAHSFPSSRQPAQGQKSKEICLVGSFHWAPKRFNAVWLASQVFPKVLAQVPDASLQIVGSNAQSLAPAIAQVPRVFLHSNVPDLQPYYDRAAVAAVPEMQESGLKLKVLEAAAQGIAIVSTPQGLEGTRLQDGMSCLAAHNADEFAACIIRLLQDRAAAERLGQSAREEVCRHFSIDAVRLQMERMLREQVLADPASVALC